MKLLKLKSIILLLILFLIIPNLLYSQFGDEKEYLDSLVPKIETQIFEDLKNINKNSLPIFYWRNNSIKYIQTNKFFSHVTIKEKEYNLSKEKEFITDSVIVFYSDSIMPLYQKILLKLDKCYLVKITQHNWDFLMVQKELDLSSINFNVILYLIDLQGDKIKFNKHLLQYNISNNKITLEKTIDF